MHPTGQDHPFPGRKYSSSETQAEGHLCGLQLEAFRLLLWTSAPRRSLGSERHVSESKEKHERDEHTVEHHILEKDVQC